MSIAPTIPVADTWGMHGSGGWWIAGAAVMMLFMGGMMWMMMRGMGGGGSQSRSTSSESPDTARTALEILERRFAQGEISIEEYRERREVLTSETAPGERSADDTERELVRAATNEEEP